MACYNILLRAIAALAVLLSAHRATVDAATACKALKENLLTSDGCPNDCSLCVLYSPSQKIECPTDKIDLTCKKASDFIVPNTTGPACDVTYLCQDTGESYVTIWTDTVTAVQSSGFKYPSKATIVLWAGMDNLELPDDVFVTPDNVDNLQFMFYDFSTQLERVDWNPHIKELSLIGTKLEQVPSSVAKLSLTTLDLSSNSLTTFPTSATLAKLQQLDLSSNLFTAIPDAIFAMPSLSSLDLSKGKLQNVKLNATQFSFLQHIKTLKLDASVTSCPTGYDKQTVGNDSVCVETAITTPVVVTTVPITTIPAGSAATSIYSGTRSWIAGLLGIVSVLAIAM